MGPPQASSPRAEINIEPAGKSGCPGSLLCGIVHPGAGLPKYMWLKLTLAARFSLDLFEPRCSEWVHPRIHPKRPFYDLFAVRKALTKKSCWSMYLHAEYKITIGGAGGKCHLLRYGNSASFGTGCNGIRLQNGRRTLSLDAVFFHPC